MGLIEGIAGTVAWLMAWKDLVQIHLVQQGIVAALILIGGWLLACFLERRMPWTRVSDQHRFVLRRIVKYTVFFFAITVALRVLGVDLGVLLGAAGILTVAIGFAAQTSASNLISGLFLLVERPFVVGDTIRIGDTTGKVLAIDLLSVRLVTADNLLVRIPSETLLKSNMTNLTHFSTRRLDLALGVAYKENLARVREVALVVAAKNPLCLQEPKPQVWVLSYGDSAINLQFSVWCTTENLLELRSSMYESLKLAFDAEGIELPFPHRSLYAGATTEPFSVRLVSAEESSTKSNTPPNSSTKHA